MITRGAEPVLVACPDARPPAYQAVIGLDRAGLLRSFQSGPQLMVVHLLAIAEQQAAPGVGNLIEQLANRSLIGPRKLLLQKAHQALGGGIDRRACRRRVQQYFSIETMVAGYERVYCTICDREAERRR